MKDLNKSGRIEEDIIHESLALYQLKQPKGVDFSFEHCWIILREMSCWVELCNDLVIPDFLKRKCYADALAAPSDSTMESEVVDESTHGASVTRQPQSSSSGGSKKPSSVKQSKKDLDNGKTREQAAHAQPQAPLGMARATYIKAQIFQDKVAQQLLGINIAKIFDLMGREYHALRRDEELKLKRRLQEPELNLPVAFETNVVGPPIPPSLPSSHHPHSPPIISSTPNTMINPIDVGDDLSVDVGAHEDTIGIEGE